MKMLANAGTRNATVLEQQIAEGCGRERAQAMFTGGGAKWVAERELEHPRK
jgi:hypothetical protein